MAGVPPRWLIAAGACLLLAAPAPSACSAELPDVTGARDIRIEDRWAGYGPAAPTAALIALRPAAGEVRGSASFSVGCRDADGFKPIEQSVELRIRSVRLSLFLYALSQSSLRPGPYKPLVTHTDDAPSITIDVDSERGRITFFTRSQGPRHVPWGVRFDGHEYVVTNDSPMRAYDELRPYLRLDILDALAGDAERRTCGLAR